MCGWTYEPSEECGIVGHVRLIHIVGSIVDIFFSFFGQNLG